jgi:hypothetical protein
MHGHCAGNNWPAARREDPQLHPYPVGFADKHFEGAIVRFGETDTITGEVGAPDTCSRVLICLLSMYPYLMSCISSP